MTTEPSFLALVVRRARERRQLTGTALAAMRGVDPSRIPQREHDVAPMNETLLEDFADGFRVSMAELLLEQLAESLPERAREIEALLQQALTVRVEGKAERRIFGFIVRNARVSRGYSLATFAAMCGWTTKGEPNRATVLQMEDPRPKSEGTLARVAEACGVTLPELLLEGLTAMLSEGSGR